MSANPKLAELRAKTDRELVAILGSEIERGLSFVWTRAGNREKAERAYRSVRKLLPAVDDRAERIRLESELVKLSELLGGSPGPPDARVCSASG